MQVGKPVNAEAYQHIISRLVYQFLVVQFLPITLLFYNILKALLTIQTVMDTLMQTVLGVEVLKTRVQLISFSVLHVYCALLYYS